MARRDTKERTLVRKVRIALHTIGLDSTNIDQDEETEAAETPKAIVYAQLARAVDEYVCDMIMVKSKAGHGLPAIAEYLGLEQDTILHMGSTKVEGSYQGKAGAKLSDRERLERNRIIIDLYEKGFRQVDIIRKMNISAPVVNTIISKHLGKNK